MRPSAFFLFAVAGVHAKSDILANVFAGYQAWFSTPSDTTDLNFWSHWAFFDVVSSPTTTNASSYGRSLTFEMYPDASAYSETYTVPPRA